MKFKVDRKGIAMLKMEPEMHAFIGALGAVVAEGAVAIAPHRTGRYDMGIDPRALGSRNAVCRVYAHDFKSWWIEMGAGPSPVRGNRPFLARHPLQRACLMTGLDFHYTAI